MEKIDIILWVVSGGFSLMLVMWHFLNQKIEDVEDKLTKKIEDVEDKLTKKIDKLDEKVTDIDRRVCRMEGAMHNKDGCVIKASNELRKAE